MDLELSPRVTLQYMILQPEKEFQRIHRETRQNGTWQSGLSEKLRILHGKVFATGDKRCPVAISRELMWRCPPKIVGTLSKDHDDGSENVGKKNEFGFFQTWSRLFGPAQYLTGRRLFLALNSYGFYSGSKRWRKIRRRMSTSSIKRQIRRFHVVVVQWTSKKCTKKRDSLLELLFWSRRCGRRRSCLSSLITNSRF